MRARILCNCNRKLAVEPFFLHDRKLSSPSFFTMEKTVLVCLLNRTREVTYSADPDHDDETAVLVRAVREAFADVKCFTPSSQLLLQVQ